MKKIAISFLISIVSISFSYAENISGVIRGTVLDEENSEPLDYVSVAVYNADDKSLVTGSITETGGSFEIKGLDQGQYYLVLSFIGYDNKELENIETVMTIRNWKISKYPRGESIMISARYHWSAQWLI